jgi:hypothetical protein
MAIESADHSQGVSSESRIALGAMRYRRRERMTVIFPGQEPKIGIITWVCGPRAYPDAGVTPDYTAPDGTVVIYEAINLED